MRAAVLDTSVAIAWYLPEAFADPAREWQAKLLDQRVSFYVPSLHFWEIGNVLRTYVARGNLDEMFAREVWQLHLDAPLEVAEPSRHRVFSLALEFQATAYDAVYIALALDLELPLITAERRTTPWVMKLGDQAITVS